MFSMFKRKNSEVEAIYETVTAQARAPQLYTDFGVPDNPYGRFQMIALHAAPYFNDFINQGRSQQSQALFDMIFRDIELSFREIGVGDLSVPKKMKKYMQQMNALIHEHAATNADHVDITRRNVFGEEGKITEKFESYIKGLFND